MNAVVHIDKGFPNFTIVTKISPLREQNNDQRNCQPCRYLPVKSVNGQGDVSERP